MTTGSETVASVKALIDLGTTRLEGELTIAHGEAARLSNLLLMGVSGMDKAQLISREGDVVADDVHAAFLAGLARCCAGESVYRVIGRREFYGLDLELNSATLEPRPDTECLVDLVLKHARSRFNKEITFADLGTGSGAIALALLQNLPEARATLVDVVGDALAMAEQNAVTHGLVMRCKFVQSSWLDGLDGSYSFIVSNPPYIRSNVIAGLAANVRDYDPSMALDGGVDGLAPYRIILADAGSLLSENGFLAFEIGYDQAADVKQLAHEYEWNFVDLAYDLNGCDRAIIFAK